MVKTKKNENNEFPANSPDLNPIENLWWIVNTMIHKKGPFNITYEIWNQFEAECEKIEINICKTLIKSIPKKIQSIKILKNYKDLIKTKIIFKNHTIVDIFKKF
ncbi:hypothetical protein RFI_20047 [Reticulomyxa filosa]|uniref:Tc1-like transposase DDE domain-containing protein n=1 Tax=Reticulomyxa filosa TaxID=46433 RepID=X6MTH2_RETFI|nr:hypothetical protein RFI_20047 [Reticulomyxa filosa]|eukprot:ETO17278.1 hypothetical protein RFI_20047 [Reticulomyxa filosa]